MESEERRRICLLLMGNCEVKFKGPILWCILKYVYGAEVWGFFNEAIKGEK